MTQLRRRLDFWKLHDYPQRDLATIFLQAEMLVQLQIRYCPLDPVSKNQQYSHLLFHLLYETLSWHTQHNCWIPWPEIFQATFAVSFFLFAC
uniref:Uncharacterized protein n=1 Tax=Arundo donax TaxID=35708 RepID=A0A0A9DRF7_ARUDO